ERCRTRESLRALQGKITKKCGTIPQAHVVHRGIPRHVKRDRTGCLDDAVARGAPRDALPRVPATAHLVGASRPRVTGVQAIRSGVRYYALERVVEKCVSEHQPSSSNSAPRLYRERSVR